MLCITAAWLALAPPSHAQEEEGRRARVRQAEQQGAPDLLGPGEMLEGPVDPRQYPLGPGDLLLLRIASQPPVDHTLRMSPEGYIILPEGPSVRLSGVTVAAAESTVARVLSRYYRDPAVRLQLLQLRTFGVFLVGEVEHPGIVRASAMDRASAVISRGGGVTQRGSRRSIRLVRPDGSQIPVDLGLFEATGNLLHNPMVDGGDRIYVPPAGDMGAISGAVRKPGPVEIAPGDSVATLMALGHGLRSDALPDSAYIESFSGSAESSTRQILNLADPRDRRKQVLPRDLVFVRQHPTWRKTRSVRIEGEVRYPGTHALPADSLRLTQVVDMAGGFTEFASLHEAYVIRPQETLPSDPEFERLSTLASSDMTSEEAEYYALRLKSRRPVVSVDFAALFSESASAHDIYVRPGDEIHVPRLSPYVMVVGEVGRPGNIPYEANLTVADYIERAGGYTWRASTRQTAVIRALTGEWLKGKGKLTLGPGDTIWVPRKPLRNYWRIALESISVIAQLATVYLVIDNAVSK